MTIQECAEAVAAQQERVEALGMTNTSQLATERLRQLAEYAAECAKLTVLREQLLDLMRQQTTMDAMQEQSNRDLRAVEALYRIH